MADRTRPDRTAPRPRRSKTVWPWILGVLLVVLALILLGFALGWFDTAGELPAG